MQEWNGWFRWVIGAGILGGLTACSGADADPEASNDVSASSVEVPEVAVTAAALKAPTCLKGSAGVIQGDVSSGEEYGGIVDLTGITEITGSAYLSTRPEILATAACLKRVGGDLYALREFANQDGVTNLHGLENLERVDGAVTVDDGYYSVPGSSLEGLSGLTRVGADLSLRFKSLTSLHGLESLKSVGGNFSIEGANGLESLRALKNLEKVALNFAVTMDFAATTVLTNLRGLEGVRQLGGLQLSNIGSLTSLKGLPDDASIAGDVTLQFLGSLPDLKGLSGIRKIGGTLSLQSVPLVKNLRGLEQVRHLGALGLQSNTSLSSLEGLSSVTAIDGDAFIIDNPALSSLHGLERLRTVGNDMEIGAMPLTSVAGLAGLESVGILSFTSLPNLTSLDGLEHLKTVSQALHVQSDVALTRIDALSHVTTLGAIAFIDDLALTSLHGLEGVTAMDQLSLTNLPALASLMGLSGLTEVAGNAIFWQLPALPSLAGLEALRSVGSPLAISVVPLITNLDPLDGLAQAGSLWITHDTHLPGCEAEALAARLAVTCTTPTWTVQACVDNCPYAYPYNLFYCRTPCDSIGYAVCSGTCTCTGNDNPGTCAP
jgi:hypothetical protein